MPEFTPARPAGPQPDHTADEASPETDRRKMVDRLAELQARQGSLTDEELDEMKLLGRALS